MGGASSRVETGGYHAGEQGSARSSVRQRCSLFLRLSKVANPYYLEKYSETEAPKGGGDLVGGGENQESHEEEAL
jgi:hypothetical protein